MTLIPCFTAWTVSYYLEKGALHDTIYERTPRAKIGLFQNRWGGANGCVLGGLYVRHDGIQGDLLEDWAKERGHAFLRFDYAAHGQSEGVFTEHSVAEWAEDAAAVIAAQTSGDLILIGSSMGGWISLNLGRDMGDRLSGLILIAAAPDFTEDSMLASFTEAQKQEIAEQGVTYIPSDYGDPYPISNHLLTDSRRAFVMRAPLVFGCPVHMVQGTLDNAVSRDTALRLLDTFRRMICI